MAHQAAFSDLLRRFRDAVIVTPVTLDLSFLSGTEYASPAAGMATAVRAWIPRMRHEPPKGGLEQLARQMDNLSSNQSLRIITLAYCLRHLLEYAITYMSHGEFASSWEQLSFVVDRVHPKPNGREEQVFAIAVMSWLSAWSETMPLGLIEEIHTDTHPIVRRYCVDEGLELGSMLRDRIVWENSATSWGLQIADISASIVGKAIHNPDNRDAVKAFARLMRASHGDPAVAFHVFTINPDADRSYADKYQPLVDALSRDPAHPRNLKRLFRLR